MKLNFTGKFHSIVVLLLCLLFALPAMAQIPDKFVNLKVLPEDISRRELVGVMRGFATGLGVRCQHCHVGEEGQPLSEFDFVSDTKPGKRMARLMLKMVNNINNDHLSAIPGRSEDGLKVECSTCHRGVSRPEKIQSILSEIIESEGAEAAIQ